MDNQVKNLISKSETLKIVNKYSKILDFPESSIGKNLLLSMANDILDIQLKYYKDI